MNTTKGHHNRYLTNKGSKMTELDEIMVEEYFRHAQDEKNCVKFEDG